MRRDRRGFTLIELIAALVMSGLVIAGARSLLSALGDSAGRTTARASEQDERAAVLGMLRDLTASASAAGDTSFVFVGWRHEARFDSWCASPFGGEARCVVSLMILSGEHGNELSLETDGHAPMRLRTDGRPTTFTYLHRTDADEDWRPEWGSSLHSPSAIGVVTGDDTLVFGIGRSL